MGAACRFAHDAARVGLCPAFLRAVRAQANAAGTEASADGEDEAGCLLGDSCPMSHDVSDADRMPPCPAFLRGSCVEPNCALRHVKVWVCARLFG
jgi:hypothetical protein